MSGDMCRSGRPARAPRPRRWWPAPTLRRGVPLAALALLAACGDRRSPAEKAAELMREEEAFRADSIAALDGMALDTVLAVWEAPVADEDDDDAPGTAPRLVFRYHARRGWCWATTARARAGDTLRCPWRQPDSLEVDGARRGDLRLVASWRAGTTGDSTGAPRPDSAYVDSLLGAAAGLPAPGPRRDSAAATVRTP